MDKIIEVITKLSELEPSKPDLKNEDYLAGYYDGNILLARELLALYTNKKFTRPEQKWEN